MEHRIIQITAIPDTDGNYACLWALDENGGIWFKRLRDDVWKRENMQVATEADGKGGTGK